MGVVWVSRTVRATGERLANHLPMGGLIRAAKPEGLAIQEGYTAPAALRRRHVQVDPAPRPDGRGGDRGRTVGKEPR